MKKLLVLLLAIAFCGCTQPSCQAPSKGQYPITEELHRHTISGKDVIIPVPAYTNVPEVYHAK